MSNKLEPIESTNPLNSQDFIDAMLYQLLDNYVNQFRIMATDILLKFRRQLAETDEFMTITKASIHLGITRRTIYKYINTGKLNTYNHDGKIYVSCNELKYVYDSIPCYNKK